MILTPHTGAHGNEDSRNRCRKVQVCRLAEGMSDDRAKNLPILMNLLGDSDLSVRATAGVSLLLLGKTDVEKRIVAWLKSPDSWGGC